MMLTELALMCSSRSEWTGLVSDAQGVREEREADGKYVVPEVRRVVGCEPLTPSLLLVTAPAAVGKSTAAEFFSNLLKAPVLDLSRLQVGDGTLEGSLSKALGPRAYADFLEDMQGGNATLIIDALDEAEVRSGQANFQAFVRGIAGTAESISHRPAIIMLSRAESARALEDHFKQRGLHYSQYEILPFNKVQAEQYLVNRIAELYESSNRALFHLKHQVPYGEARDMLFSALARAVEECPNDPWSIPVIRDFIGYAPVLDVMAEFLAVDNFTALRNTFSEATVGSTGLPHWKLVAEVIDHLLTREQGKFVEQFSRKSEFTGVEESRLLSILYSPEEQCARLLGYIEGMDTAVEVPAHLPVHLRDVYEGAVSAQLSNHPFVRDATWFNVIFRDYVIARSLAAATTGELTAQTIRKMLLSASWKHSPMFGYFSYSLGLASDGIATCHSDEFGILYESFKSMTDTEDALHMLVARSSDHLIMFLAVIREGEDRPVFGPLAFNSYKGNRGVVFPREVSHLHIFNVPEVTLGGEVSSFKLGPEVFISCKDLLVASHEVRIHVNDDEMPVTLNVGSIVSENIKLEVRDSASLAIISDELAYPWTKYRQKFDFAPSSSDPHEAGLLYLEFRRIVLRFKDAKKGQASLFQPFVDNIVVGENRRARVVLDYLQHIGCVEVRNKMYLLSLNEYGKLGISRPQLRDLNSSEAVARLVVSLDEYNSHRKAGG